MIVITSFSCAVFFCFLAMICWGSWANTQKLTSKTWRFELFYWDLMIGIFVVGLLGAFTLGSLGMEGRPFLADVQRMNLSSILYSILGGVLWNLGNLCLVAAISQAGLAVSFPIAGSVAWTFGIAFNYVLMRIAGEQASGRSWALLVGVILVNTGMILIGKAYRRKPHQSTRASVKGIVLSAMAGLFIAFFYGFVVKALDATYVAGGTGTMTPYTGMVFMSIGIVISTFIVNPFFMRFPVEGDRVSGGAYFEGTKRDHLAGVLGGSIWMMGMIFSFMAVGSVNPVIGYALSNSAPVIAAAWGVFVWQEFKSTPPGTNTLLGFMFAFYIVGLFFITYSKV